MEVTLLGTGDTAGTPAPGCDCATCDAARARGVERTRFSVHVRNETTDECLLVDFSPDFRRQFLREDVPLPDAAVVTHVHFDHLDGIGNVYRLVDDLPVHAASETDPVAGESVADTVRDRYDFLDPLTVHGHAPRERFRVCGFDVTLVPVVHPPLVSYGVVIAGDGATLALTGDTAYSVPEESRTALAGADLLVADAIAPVSLCDRHPAGGSDRDADGVPRTFGTKHMTRHGALALADELDADEVALVHCSHHYDPGTAFEDPLAVDGDRYSL